eukprot:3812849-Amphidinium_carterae.1
MLLPELLGLRVISIELLFNFDIALQDCYRCILNSILLPPDKHRNTSGKWGKYNFLDYAFII